MSLVWESTNGSYIVSSSDHLLQIVSIGGSFTDTGDAPSDYLSDSFVQTADIDLSGTTVTPIGSSESPFTGQYDGGGYRILNWVYTGTLSHIGFFGYCASATVKNLILSGVWSLVTTTSSISGFLVGEVSGCSVYNITTEFETGTVFSAGNSSSAGLIGTVGSSSVVQGLTLGGTISTFSSSTSLGGVIGEVVSSTLYFVRNIATFETEITGTNIGGVLQSVQTSDVSYIMNAMTGDISGTGQVGGVVRALLQGTGNLTDVLVNSMNGSVTGSSRCGGIASNITGYYSDGVFNRLINYMNGSIQGSGKGGIVSYSQTFGTSGTVTVKNSINAMNGSTAGATRNTLNNSSSSSYTVRRDESFGMTYTNTNNSSTTASLTGYTTHSGFSDLSYVPFTGTDNDGNDYAWEFVFPNVSGNSNYSSYTDFVVSSASFNVPISLNLDVPDNTTEYLSYANRSSNELFIDETLVIIDSGATYVYDYTGTNVLFPGLSVTIYTHIADLSWTEIGSATSYSVTYTEDGGSEIEAVTDTTELYASVTKIKPGLTYVFTLYSDADPGNPAKTAIAVSPDVSQTSAQNMMTRISNDLSGISRTAISELEGSFRELFNTGDTITTKDLGNATFVEDSDTYIIDSYSENILAPFDSDSGTGQTFSVTLPSGTFILGYDNEADEVIYDSVHYGMNESFIVGGYKVVVKDL